MSLPARRQAGMALADGPGPPRAPGLVRRRPGRLDLAVARRRVGRQPRSVYATVERATDLT